jgi:hypothetical protein
VASQPDGAYQPERDRPGAHVPFPPMPAAWREPEPAPLPRPVPSRTQDHPITGPLPPPPVQRPMSPIAYPGLPVSAPPPYYLPYPDGQQNSGRSATVAGLLQITMFPFAVGRFYTGHVALALSQIAVAWGVLFVGLSLGMVLIVPLLVAWAGFLWPFIDGIVLLSGKQSDADGRPLRP